MPHYATPYIYSNIFQKIILNATDLFCLYYNLYVHRSQSVLTLRSKKKTTKKNKGKGNILNSFYIFSGK